MPGVAYSNAYKKLCEFACLLFDCDLSDIEDIIQDACIEVLDKKSIAYEVEVEQILLRSLFHFYRSTQTQSIDFESAYWSAEENPESLYIKRELHEALIHATNSLTKIQKLTLFYRFIEDETPLAIAKYLNQSSESVRKRLHDSMQVLKNSLQKNGYDDLFP